MGEVRSMRTPPLPSPAEAPSPVAAPHSHYHGPSQSISDLDNNGYAIVDGNPTMWKADARSFIPHEQTANSCHIPPFSKEENSDSGKGSQEDQGRGLQTLKELRRQMEELLVYQQMQQSQSQDSSTGREADPVPPARLESSTKRRTSDTSSLKLAPPSAGAIPSASYSDSTGSSGTIRAIESLTIPDNPAGQTPSYPFPKMQSQSTARHPQDPALNHGHFKLTLPSEKLKIHMAPPQILDERQSAASRTPTSHAVFLPAQHKYITEDPAYPSPNLYDLTLRLNADPGLDAWWANVVHILQTYYGAVRASLALPGDVTDLENVPWGQKAVFDQNVGNGSEPLPIVGDDSLENSGDTEKKKEDLSGGNVANGLGPAVFLKRPQLFSRHSFAGFGKEKKSTWQDSDKLQNIQKTKETLKSENQNPVPFERESSRSTPNQENTAHDAQSSNPTASSRNYQRQAVFPIPRPLEVEADPLIKRAGVVKLFGRTEPVVLTREYSQNLVAISRQAHGEIVQTPEDRLQVTPAAEHSQPTSQTSLPTHVGRSRSASNASVLGPQAQNIPLSMHFYDEYEQVPPSPWSQSPAPSPAPRAHADQNPFFTNHAVDEGAFAKHPPSHDYSNMEPLEAIGIDLAKSVVHIPLLHAGRLKQPSSTTLRFPVAVISILSPIIPYPSNLRQSLAFLIPHLTTSFCLAQQYSQLEKQFASRLEHPRYGHLLGLGGTFSDESSELELFAGLSGHVNYALADDGSLSAHASLSSPDERSTKLSPSMSGFGTPGFDLNNLGTESTVNSSESPGLALKGNGEAVDSYFSVKQSRGFREAMSQHRNRLSKAKQNSSSSTPTSPGKLWGKPADEEPFTQDPSIVLASPAQEFKMPPIISPTQASSRHPSTNSFYSQIHRELPRPFSDTDTVAQLMLNSVPLHLFLARPQSGEVIWTNSKFDAYRRSQPQEQKLRDPWQNIHLSERDHISQEWANALRTGSQFTERVRVKRFNDESTYRWFIFRANPLLSSTGEVLYWIGSFLDIHEQHIVELKATQERERSAIDAKYRAFSNSIPQVVFEAAEYRGLIFANEQWHLYTGQKLEEALNFGFAKHVHPDDLEKCGLLSLYLAESQNRFAVESNDSTSETEKANAVPPERHFNPGVTRSLDELVRRGVASVQKDENGRVFYSTEIRFRSRGGDFRWHLVRILRVETSSFGSGEASWYGTCTDINDRKNLERELNKAMQQLNSQMESKTKFFSNMSHEIRTPLNGILGTIPFILDTQLDTDQRRMLDTIQNSSTNLRELVDNILDVSRVEAGKMSLVNSWFHVRSVIEDVIDTISSRAIDKGLEMNYLMDVDVPPTVIGDRFRIRQVLINLVGNAVKFTAQGEIYIRCSVYHDASALSKETELLLNFDVVDTGKGFNARDTERLMQRFSQLGPNASQQHAGSGLGLFLSKQLVEMHGGRLTPSSTEGQGSKFSFYVKVDAPPPPSPNEPRSVQQSSSTSEMPGVQLTPSSLQKSLFSSKEFIDSKGPDASDLSTALSAHLASNNLSQRSSMSSAHPISDLHTAEPFAKINTAKSVSSQSNISQSRPNTFSSSSSDTLSPMAQRTSLGPKQSSIPSKSLPLTTGSTSSESQNQSSIPSKSLPLTTGSTSSESQNQSSIPSKSLPLATGSTSSESQNQSSILILCPFNNTRKAIEQHIEQVVPLEIPFSITSLLDVEDWRDSMNHGSGSKPTHLVLNLPNVHDILDMIQHVLECEIAAAPTLVIISDLHQKRQINSRIKELSLSGRRVYTVIKPVKPSAFSTIFDPDNRRELSKDRNQDMAREMNNNFKTMYKMVKEVIGNKGYRILLVEDDETNRMVMLKYLDKIKVMAETATNGQECTELVFSKEPGYYSLIICDIQMPVKNGYETCRDIRAWEAVNHYPQIPIMALSANAMTDQIEDAARAGFNDYVTKPIKHNELGKMLMELLDHNRPLILLRDRFKSDYEDHLSDISHGQ